MQIKVNLSFLIPQISKKKRKEKKEFDHSIGDDVEKHLNFSVALANDKMDDFTVFSSPVVSIFNFLYY